jgi:cell division transport system permease protein
MNIRTLRYLTGEGGRGLRRHRIMAVTAIVTMAASLLVLGVFLIASFNVRQVLLKLEDRKEVVVYMRTGVAEGDRTLFEERLKLHPAVAGARFVSKDEAWEEFSVSMHTEGLTDAVGHNPLPDAYHLVLAPEHRDAATIAGLASEVGTWDEVDEVVTGGEWVGRLDRFARSVLLFTAAIGIAVALSIVVIVGNTVRLTVLARQDLIHIMKSVGASEMFIRIPFLSEGVMQAALAGVVSLGALYGGTLLLSSRIADVQFISPLWCLGFLGSAVVLGFVGSALSVRHVLRQVGL